MKVRCDFHKLKYETRPVAPITQLRQKKFTSRKRLIRVHPRRCVMLLQRRLDVDRAAARSFSAALNFSACAVFFATSRSDASGSCLRPRRGALLSCCGGSCSAMNSSSAFFYRLERLDLCIEIGAQLPAGASRYVEQRGKHRRFRIGAPQARAGLQCEAYQDQAPASAMTTPRNQMQPGRITISSGQFILAPRTSARKRSRVQRAARTAVDASLRSGDPRRVAQASTTSFLPNGALISDRQICRFSRG